MPGVTTAYQTGVHGSRPANGAGCILYSCTTHSLVYRDDGTTWITFMTLTGTGYTAGGTDVAIADGGTGQSTATLGFNALSPVTTRGDLIVRGATNNDRLAIGSSGKVLTSDGTDPSWQTPSAGSAGALVLLEQHTASASATLDFTTCFSSTYDEYVIEVLRLIPATNSVNPFLRFSTDGGSTYIATGYQWAHNFCYGAGTNGVEGSSSDTGIAFVGGSVASAGVGVSATIHLYDPASASSSPKAVTAQGTRGHTSVGMVQDMGGGMLSVGVVNAFRILFNSGNITSGVVRVYGIAKT